MPQSYCTHLVTSALQNKKKTRMSTEKLKSRPKKEPEPSRQVPHLYGQVISTRMAVKGQGTSIKNGFYINYIYFPMLNIFNF